MQTMVSRTTIETRAVRTSSSTTTKTAQQQQLQQQQQQISTVQRGSREQKIFS